MGVVAWYFVEDGSGHMMRVARTAVDRFLDGSANLPSAGTEHVRVAELVLQVSGRRVQRVHRVLWPQWALTPDGRCDRDVREAYARLAMRQFSLADPADVVVPLDPAIARREIIVLYEWTPSEIQLHEVARLINARAVKPPVVAIGEGELLPV